MSKQTEKPQDDPMKGMTEEQRWRYIERNVFQPAYRQERVKVGLPPTEDDWRPTVGDPRTFVQDLILQDPQRYLDRIAQVERGETTYEQIYREAATATLQEGGAQIKRSIHREIIGDPAWDEAITQAKTKALLEERPELAVYSMDPREVVENCAAYGRQLDDMGHVEDTSATLKALGIEVPGTEGDGDAE